MKRTALYTAVVAFAIIAVVLIVPGCQSNQPAATEETAEMERDARNEKEDASQTVSADKPVQNKKVAHTVTAPDVSSKPAPGEESKEVEGARLADEVLLQLGQKSPTILDSKSAQDMSRARGYGGMGAYGGGAAGKIERRLGWDYESVDESRIAPHEKSNLYLDTNSASCYFWRGGAQGEQVMPVDKRTGIPVDLLTLDEDEIWIIAKAETAGRIVKDEGTPGCGALMATLPGEEKQVPVPLNHTDVRGRVSGYIATVEVTQQFHNPFSAKIEASYVFPLPQDAAVNEFIMTIGDRKIRGIIREREEAEEIYRRARAQGHVASLLTQERPNIFTQKVANIEPDRQIDINIKYFNTLAYVDGWYEFVFPMVVGPRFNPPGSTDGVGAVARGQTGVSGQQTEVQYLAPNERSGHDISLQLDIDAGVKIEEVKSVNHVVREQTVAPEKLAVCLSPNDTIPNKDFVLRFKVAGDRVKSALVTHRDKRGGYFTLMLYPPETLKHIRRSPMEMIFVLDCSGSMSGAPIAQAKTAIIRGLRMLGSNDTFQVIRFSNNASQFGPEPVAATPENIAKAVTYVETLRGSGGTMMIEGIKAALDFPHDPRRFRLVSFMTDGFIGNEQQILKEVFNRLGESRIFSFGVGSSPNRFLLGRMAAIGRGAVAYMSLNDNVAEVMDAFYERISHPALTDVRIDWGALEVSDVYPARLPDLFVGRPIILTGRFEGDTDTAIRITGSVEGEDRIMDIPANLENTAAKHPGIACVWARRRIADLSNRMTSWDRGNTDLPLAIKDTALAYSLMSAYTAFVAVDSSTVTEGDAGYSVAVPVPVPDGVKYETTVQN